MRALTALVTWSTGPQPWSINSVLVGVVRSGATYASFNAHFDLPEGFPAVRLALGHPADLVVPTIRCMTGDASQDVVLTVMKGTNRQASLTIVGGEGYHLQAIGTKHQAGVAGDAVQQVFMTGRAVDHRYLAFCDLVHRKGDAVEGFRNDAKWSALVAVVLSATRTFHDRPPDFVPTEQGTVVDRAQLSRGSFTPKEAGAHRSHVFQNKGNAKHDSGASARREFTKQHRAALVQRVLWEGGVVDGRNGLKPLPNGWKPTDCTYSGFAPGCHLATIVAHQHLVLNHEVVNNSFATHSKGSVCSECRAAKQS